MTVSTVSVVIPVYNSRESLKPLIGQLHPLLVSLQLPFEIILVNDCSKDDSWSVIQQLHHQWPGVTGINLSRNYGQHNAILCGIRNAHHDVIVTMDDDGQHPPEEIPRLLAELKCGFDVVYGWPENAQHSKWRNLASLATKIAMRHALGNTVTRRIGAFRAFRTDLRDAFAVFRGPYVSIDVMLSWATTRFSYICVRHEPRRVGNSGYTFWKLVRHASNIITGFSTMPLRFSSLVGSTSIIFGFLILLWVVARYFLDSQYVPGFPFLASIIVIFSGVNLFCLGVIGEYLAHIHLRTMDHPSYVVKEKTLETVGGLPHADHANLPSARVG